MNWRRKQARWYFVVVLACTILWQLGHAIAAHVPLRDLLLDGGFIIVIDGAFVLFLYKLWEPHYID